MVDPVKKLEQRIRRLKADALATNSWRRLRIEIERHGGKWRAENGVIFELRDGAIYQYLSDPVEGVSNLIITALDAPIPYVAELDIDLQGVPPEKRKTVLQELAETAAKLTSPPVELVTIIEHDWLTKISKARWGTLDWKRHLKPTETTLHSRRRKAKGWNPDLIYPGDTFEVTA